MSDTKITKKLKGRPSKTISWPQNTTFTVTDIFNTFNNETDSSRKVSKVTIQNKINRDIINGVLIKDGSKANPRGRQAVIYRLKPVLTS
jgi:hypothetical protein